MATPTTKNPTAKTAPAQSPMTLRDRAATLDEQARAAKAAADELDTRAEQAADAAENAWWDARRSGYRARVGGRVTAAWQAFAEAVVTPGANVFAAWIEYTSRRAETDTERDQINAHYRVGARGDGGAAPDYTEPTIDDFNKAVLGIIREHTERARNTWSDDLHEDRWATREAAHAAVLDGNA